MSYSAVDPRATDRKSETAAKPTDARGVPSAPIDRLLRYLEKLSSGSFFGKVVVSFQNGKVCDVKIEQTKKLDEL
jgi:hypothetical protein